MKTTAVPASEQMMVAVPPGLLVNDNTRNSSLSAAAGRPLRRARGVLLVIARWALVVLAALVWLVVVPVVELVTALVRRLLPSRS
jgi:hypothetical protein